MQSRSRQGLCPESEGPRRGKEIHPHGRCPHPLCCRTMQPAAQTAVANLVGASDLVHQRSRLGILMVLAMTGRSDFQELRRVGRLTDGNLSRHLFILEAAGLVAITKGYVGRRPHTWAEITDAGRAGLDRELELLRQLLVIFDQRAGN